MSTNRTLIQVASVLVLIAGCLGLAQASTVGRIAGVITDTATGLPLGNANVLIQGTVLGGASGPTGEYFILNVPAGTYSIQASLIGYKSMVIDNILVSPDFTTDVNFSLEQTVAATLEPIKVNAERPLIQRDATATVRILDSKQYGKLPTRGYQDAASIQAGVVSSQGSSSASLVTQNGETNNNPILFIRGGRPNEVAYFVDGFSQQDPLTGYSTTSINNNAVQQVVVMTGGFNAEYGRIMSGAVNVVTREGGPKYFGTAEALTDNLAPWVGSKKYDYNVYDLSLGGPVMPGNDQLTFFASSERRWQADRSPHSEVGGRLPNDFLSGYTWQGKLDWKWTPNMDLKVGTLGSRDDWREYLNTYRFNIDHTPRYEDRNDSYFATFTHSLKATTFYNLSANYFLTERERGDGVYFDDLMAYARPDGNPRFDETTLFWLPEHVTADGDTIPAHAYDDYLHRKSSYIGLAGDLTHKWSEHSTAKLGVDFQRHTLRLYNHLFPSQAFKGVAGGGYQDVVNYGYDITGQHELNGKEGQFEDGAKHPITASLYVQNKYEYNDFVLNAGLRYDHLDPKTASLADASRPFGPRQGDASLDPADLKPSKKQDKVSPRLGVGFPVSPTTLFHANYGKFFQQPNLQDLYTSYRYLEYKVRKGGYYFPFGNPNLVPETTTAYEVGLTRAFTPQVRFDITAYYKDVNDLVQVQNVPSSPTNFASFRNTDYGTIKGVDLNLQLMETQGLSGELTYSLSYASGTGSISDTQHNIAWTADEVPKQTAPLAFDQRHKIALNVDISGGRLAGPSIGGMHPLEKTGLNILYNLGSGFPYTPVYPENQVTLAAISTVPSGAVNSRYGPWTQRMDAKLTRDFEFGGLAFQGYVWVLNLFDTTSQLTVYSTSGSAFTTEWLSTEAGRKWVQEFGQSGTELYGLAERDPNNFGIPRMVRFGIKTSF